MKAISLGLFFLILILLPSPSYATPEYAGQVPGVGELLPVSVIMGKSAHEKVFYFMAYINLIFVFLITFIIALWRWW